ncbi:MAG TPA: 23S rRNA (uracil(1939)-C(5))-methyltransferase RlmD [Bacteroidales bacterium]|nr:23S rRNA (uracil(1939)-C(5))-methyltransferase RlmD [Bacteroidales bacterium]
MGRKKPLPLLRGVTITDIGSEGNAIAKVNDMVLFVPGMIPGDVVDVRVTKKKKRHMEGVAVAVVSPSPDRIKPRCRHFGTCGGCRWQHLPYDKQLFYKEKQVKDNLTRISHASIPDVAPILGSENDYLYRNKLEFTFSDKRWMTHDEVKAGKEIASVPALGFHVPGVYDKAIDIYECHLLPEPSDSIRNEVRNYALANGLLFYNRRDHEGFMRNLIVRITTTGEVMVIVIMAKDMREERKKLLDHIVDRFPQVTSLWYILNTKQNDSLSDQEPLHYAGREFITEEMDNLRFRVGPKSFYQTNSRQAARLYGIVRDFARLSGTENVYDLYTGAGTIACYLASGASKVTGIEYIREAVADAAINAAANNISNTLFIAGDMKDMLNESLFAERGRPDVIITDPPRAGMHVDVVAAILRSGADRIVYVSCNPATQARDIGLLAAGYNVMKVQPVDMFPQTYHIENVTLMKKI